MKKSMFLALATLILCSGMAVGQDLVRSDVPESILSHFDQEFSKARDVEWEKDGENFNVDFEVKRGVDVEVWYSTGGEIVRKEEEWKKSKLPKAVKKAIEVEYGDYKIDEAKKITEGKDVQYKLDLESSGMEDMDVWVNEQGQVIDSRRD